MPAKKQANGTRFSPGTAPLSASPTAGTGPGAALITDNDVAVRLRITSITDGSAALSRSRLLSRPRNKIRFPTRVLAIAPMQSKAVGCRAMSLFNRREGKEMDKLCGRAFLIWAYTCPRMVATLLGLCA